jgi:hypothetical protein
MLVTTPDGRRRRDRRYTVRPEYCGERARRFVARFCGDWIGHAKTRTEARELAEAFEELRMAPYQPGEGAAA